MKQYKKYFELQASPDEVYNALTNPITINIWTNSDAEMALIPGSEFSLFDGNIVGVNIEFIENKKIVQQWYFENDAAEPLPPSIVTIKLHPHVKGTSVELLHIDIPDEAFDDIVEGWEQVYFGNLAEFFNDDDGA